MLNSTSSKNGLYSDISFRIDFLSFSEPENFPPSFFGRNVQTHLGNLFFILSNTFGMSDDLRKSNLTSAYSDLPKAFFRMYFIFFGFFSAIETHVLYFISYFSKMYSSDTSIPKCLPVADFENTKTESPFLRCVTETR